MSWVALAVSAGTAAYGAYNSYSTQQEAEANAANIFGTRPDVAPFVPTNLGDEQAKAAGANLSNADSIFAMLDRFVPGYSNMLRQGTDNAQSLLRGELPQDVQDQVMRSSAFQSLSGGFSGTDMGRALTARDLGKTSLDLQQMGNNSAQMWTKLATDTASPFMINTMQQAGTTANNNAGTQATEQFRFNVAAGADPSAAGVFNTQIATNAQMQQSLAGIGSAYGNGGGTGTRTAGVTGGANGAPFYTYNRRTGQYEQVQQGYPVATTSTAWG